MSGFLKRREGMFAALGVANEADAKDLNLLCSIVQLDESIELRVCTIKPFTNSVSDTLSSRLRSVTSYALHSADQLIASEREFHFLPRLGLIYYITRKGLASIDLSDDVPKEQIVVSGLGSRISGFISVTSSLVFLATKDTGALCDTTYGAILASVPFKSERSTNQPDP